MDVTEAYDFLEVDCFGMEGNAEEISFEGSFLCDRVREEFENFSCICSLSLFMVRSAGHPAYVAWV